MLIKWLFDCASTLRNHWAIIPKRFIDIFGVKIECISLNNLLSIHRFMTVMT